MRKSFQIISLFLIVITALNPNAYALNVRRSFKNPIQTLSCLPTNGQTSGSKVSNDYGRTFGTCSGYSCSSGYSTYASAGTCVASTQSCTGSISNASSASQTWTGSAYGTCTLGSCNSGYSPSGNTCVGSSYNVVCASNGNGCAPAARYGTGVTFSVSGGCNDGSVMNGTFDLKYNCTSSVIGLGLSSSYTSSVELCYNGYPVVTSNQSVYYDPGNNQFVTYYQLNSPTGYPQFSCTAVP